MRLALIVFAGALVACGSSRGPLAPSPNSTALSVSNDKGDSSATMDSGPRGSVDYRCGNGSAIRAEYDTMGGVTIRWNGRSHALRRNNATSELVYRNAGYTWSASGDQFVLIERGQAVASGCKRS